jgi:hypothetical protein
MVFISIITVSTLFQGCHNGHFWMKITVRTSVDVVRTSARVRGYSADVVLPVDGFLPSEDSVKTAAVRTPYVRVAARGHASCGHGSARTWGRVRADTRSWEDRV